MNKFKELADKLNEACQDSEGMKDINWQVIWDLIVEIVPIVLRKLG